MGLFEEYNIIFKNIDRGIVSCLAGTKLLQELRQT